MAITAAQLNVRFNSDGADRVANDARSLGGSLDNLGKKSQGFWSNAMSSGLGFVGANIFGKVASSMGGFLTAGIDFEAQMSAIQAVTGATGTEFQALSDLALQIGQDTNFGATEAAQAIEELAKAGVSTENILNGAADGVTALAAAGGVDLPSAAVVMSAAMNQFGLAGDQATRVADLLAAASATSATGVLELGESLKYVGTSASAIGYSIEDVTTALAIMADQGMVGSMAGTALNNVLLSMANPGTTAAAAMSELGISFTNLDGSMKSLPQVVNDLMAATSGLTDVQRMAYLEQMFGVEGARAMNALLQAQANEAAGTGKGWNDYYAAVTQSGAAAEQAAARMNNFSGDMEALKGSIETAAIMLMMTFLPSLRGIVQGLTGVVNFVSQVIGVFAEMEGYNPFERLMRSIRLVILQNFTGKWVVPVVRGLNQFEDAANSVAGVVQRVASWIRDQLGRAFEFLGNNMDYVLPALRGIGIALGLLAGAGTVMAVITGLGIALGLLLSPVTLIIAAVAALSVAWSKNWFDIQGKTAAAISFIKSHLDQIITVFAALTGPIGMAILTIVRHWDELTAAFKADGIVGALKAFTSALLSEFGGVLDIISTIVSEISSLDWGGFLQGAWNVIETGLQLAWDAIRSIDWGDFIQDLAWDAFVMALEWADWIAGKIADFGGWLASKVSDIPWGTIISGTIAIASWLGDKISDIPWTSILQGVIDISAWLSSRVSDIPWTSILQGVIDVSAWLSDRISDIPWTTIISGMVEIGTWLGQKVSDIPWTSIIQGVIDFSAWLGDRFEGIPWTSIIQGVIDISAWLGDRFEAIPWTSIITGAIEIGSWLLEKVTAIGAFAWSSFIKGSIENFSSWLAEKAANIATFDWLGLIKGTIADLGAWLASVATNIATFDWTGLIGTLGQPFGDWLGGFVDQLSWDLPSAGDILDAIKEKINPLNWNLPGPLGSGGLDDAMAGRGGPAAGPGALPGSGSGTGAGASIGVGRGNPFADLIAALTELTTAFTTAQTTITTATTAISTAVGTMALTAGTNLQALLTAVTAVFVTAIPAVITTGLDAATTTVGIETANWSTTAGTNMQALLTAATAVFVTAIPAVVLSGMTTSSSTIETETNNWESDVSSKTSEIESTVSENFEAVKRAILQNMSEAAREVQSKLAEMARETGSRMSEIARTGDQKARDFARAIRDGFQEAVGNVRDALGDIQSEVSGFSIYDDGYGIGQDFSQGIADGIASLIWSIAAEAAAVVNAAIDAAKNAQQSASPSRVMRGEGRNWGSGYMLGIRETAQDVAQAAADVVNGAIAASRVQVPGAINDAIEAISKPVLEGIKVPVGGWNNIPESTEFVTYIPMAKPTPSTSTVTTHIAPNAITVIQQPGEDGEALAYRVVQELRDGIWS